MNEYEFEPVRGLPEALPAGEHIVWQGEPRWPGLARHAFHAAKVGWYFLLLVAIHAGLRLQDGASLGAVAQGAAWLTLLGVTGGGLLVFIGWLYSRTTVYTLTNKRLVLRVGVAIPMMINIPLSKVDGAELKRYGDGSGNIALTMHASQRIPYWVVWPHARPWHFAPARPMLRDIPEVDTVSQRLAELLVTTAGRGASRSASIEAHTPVGAPASNRPATVS